MSSHTQFLFQNEHFDFAFHGHMSTYFLNLSLPFEIHHAFFIFMTANYLFQISRYSHKYIHIQDTAACHSSRHRPNAFYALLYFTLTPILQGGVIVIEQF